ncbi:hypothetical protein QCA50_012464 [Cerrena zonata]|uniref:NACHT domain-containing protein n=1 Tax=Cerrena zonata TaxID=2478898 RepID=A0AAW0FWF7_9APHY
MTTKHILRKFLFLLKYDFFPCTKSLPALPATLQLPLIDTYENYTWKSRCRRPRSNNCSHVGQCGFSNIGLLFVALLTDIYNILLQSCERPVSSIDRDPPVEPLPHRYKSTAYPPFLLPYPSTSRQPRNLSLKSDTSATMVTNIALKIHYVQEVKWKSRFPGQDIPALYVEVTYGDRQVKTKAIRDLEAQWDEELIIHGIDDHQILRFRLKAAFPLGRDPVLGALDYKAEDLSSSCNSPYNTQCLKLKSTKDSESPTTSCITINATPLTHQDATRRLVGNAQAAAIQQLDPNSLAGKVWHLLGRLDLISGIISKVDQVAKLNSSLDLGWQILSSLYKVVDKQRTTDQKVIEFVDTINQTFDFVDDAEKLREHVINLSTVISDMLNQMAECALFVCKYLQKSFPKRMAGSFLTDPNKKIDEFTQTLAKLREKLDSRVRLRSELVSFKIHNDICDLRDVVRRSDALKELKPAAMNAANRPLCLHGTRESVMQTIIDWVVNIDDNEQNILWLHGLAGSGKSTIANTVSARLHDLRRLGAFLFFERDKTDRDAVIHTMAAQLADANPVLQSKISAAIEQDRRSINSHLEAQFDHLVRRPLDDSSPSLLGPIVIVLDALDEYGDINSRRSLLTLIADEFKHLPINFRFLITSRPELDIDNMFSGNPKIASISLNEIKDTVPEIRLYLSSELAHIRKVKRISDNWPEEGSLDRAAHMSEGLFIWASTLSRFLLETHDPAETLESVLWSSNKEHAIGLDQLYATILNAKKGWHSGLGERFRAVARIVLLSQIPLSDIDIDQLLGRPDGKSCRGIFEDFHCLFDHNPGWPIRPLHASFGDYLTDVTRSGGQPWSLAKCDMDHDLVLRCFHIMSTQLRFNICNFETSGRLNKDYPDLKERIDKHISPQLRYASTCWRHHLKGTRTWQEDVGSALRSFSEEKLLFWLEVASLVGGVWDTLRVCNIAYRFAVDTDSKLATLWTNLEMFIVEYAEAIFDSALHVYISAHSSPFTEIHNWDPQPGTIAQLTHNHDIFPTALSHTTSCKHYLACSPDRLLLLSDCSSGSLWVQWKPLWGNETTQSSAQLEKPYPNGSHRRPECITVSSDCRRVAGHLGGKGVISIWDVETGRVEIYNTELKSFLIALAFHPQDSDQLAILSSSMISVWNITEGIMYSIKINHDAYQIAWSPDGAYLASRGSESSAVWSVNRTTATITLQKDFSDLKGHALCFSPKIQSHILLACKRELFVYDFKSNEQVFGPYTANNLSPITAFLKGTFSPDGSLIATSSRYTIQIFETESGQPYQDAIMVPDWVHQLTFLPDGKQIAALVGDTVYMWELCRVFQISDQERFDRANIRSHFRGIASISFSPDGTKFLSSSEDGTVHVRSSTDCMLLREYWPMEYPQDVTTAVFSADNKTVYLALDDGTVRTSLGNVLYRPKERQLIHNFYVYVSQLTSEEHIVFSPFESKKVFVIPSNGDPEQDLREISLEGALYRSAVSSNGLIASFSSNSGTVEFVNLEGDHSPHPLLITKYTQSVILLFSQKGDVLVSLGKDTGNNQDRTCSYYGINVWDIKSATCLQTLSLPDLEFLESMALNANLLALTNRQSIVIYDIEKGALVHTFDSWDYISYLDIHGSKLISSYHGQIIMSDLSALHTDGTTPHPNAAGTPPSIHSSSVSPQWSIEHGFYRPTGWVLDSNGERLLWVPGELWDYLDPPGSTHVISRRRRIKWPDFIPDMDWLKNYEGVGRFSME